MMTNNGLPRDLKDPLLQIPQGVLPPPGSIPFAQNHAGLFVPAKYVRMADEPVPIMMQYSVTMVGWEELFGAPASLPGILERLKQYSLREIVSMVGRATLALHLARKTTTENYFEGQRFIAERFLGRELTEWVYTRVAAATEADIPLGSRALFQERQLLNAIKLAFSAVDVGVADKGNNPIQFVEALLMLSDVIDPPEGTFDADTAEGRSGMELYITANTLFNEGAHPVHDAVRAFNLYILPHPELASRSIVDVPAALKRASGLEATTIWMALYALYGAWSTLTLEDLDAGRIIHRRSEYLSTMPRLSVAEQMKWFNLATWEVADLQVRLRGDYSLEDPRFFDILPFEERPLVAFGDDVYCMSFPLLERLLGSSIQHRLMDKTVFEPKETRRFLDTRGHLVEGYTVELLASVFGDRFIPEERLQKLAGGESVCDGMIIYPGAVLLLECKTMSPLLGTRHGENYEVYRAKWREAMVKAADQFESTIQHIEQGSFEIIGVDRNSTEVYPVIGVFEQPIQPPVYRAIRMLDLAGHPLEVRMHAGKTRSLQLLHIKEIEMVAMAAEKGRNILEVLQEKTSNPEMTEISLHHFLDLRGETFHRGHSRWHSDRFDEMTRSARTLFRSLGMGDETA